MSSVSELVAGAAVFMRDSGYSPITCRSYQRVWDQFDEYCIRCLIAEPDRRGAAAFFEAVGVTGGEQQQVFVRRAVNCLFDVAESGRFSLRAGRGRIPVPECFTDVFAGYTTLLGCLGLAAGTLRAKAGFARRFLAFLANLGVTDMGELTVADVSAYVRSFASLAASTRANQLYMLRDFLRFAVAEYGADSTVGGMFPVIVADKDAVLPSVYKPGEIAAALKTVGEHSETPLRDRAVILLAAVLGLRSSDIKGLQFADFDWANRRLSLVGSKTGRRLDLPLPDECMYAIVDYWKNERPEVGDEYVFIRHRAPHRPLAAGNHFHDLVDASFNRAGVETAGKHHGLHSLRHSAAVGMLDTGTGYPVIGAVLGHANANTTRRYLRVDVEHLRPLALEVPDDH